MPETIRKEIRKNHRLMRPRVWGAAVTSGLAALGANTANHALSPASPVERVTPVTQVSPDNQSTNLLGLAASNKRHHPPKKSGAFQTHPNVKPSNAVKPPSIVVPPQEISSVSEPANLHPERLSVPSNVSEIMRENVAYLPGVECSGFLIRDINNIPIGVLTAQHCSLRTQNGHFVKGDAGEARLHFDTPFTVETGDSYAGMTAAGLVSEFLLTPGDDTHDVALGIFQGHTAEEVAARYKEISIQNINDLKQGDVIYNSGWPINQPNNTGPMARQEFAMSVLGQGHWTIDNGENLQLLIAAVPVESAMTECSWGDSGSAAFIVGKDGKPKIVGALSAFNDFGQLYNKDKPDSAATEKSFISSVYNVDMSGYAGVCGFSFEKPDTGNSATVAIDGWQ